MHVNFTLCVIPLCLAVWIKPFELFKIVPPSVCGHRMGIRNNDCEDVSLVRVHHEIVPLELALYDPDIRDLAG